MVSRRKLYCALIASTGIVWSASCVVESEAGISGATHSLEQSSYLSPTSHPIGGSPTPLTYKSITPEESMAPGPGEQTPTGVGYFDPSISEAGNVMAYSRWGSNQGQTASDAFVETAWATMDAEGNSSYVSMLNLVVPMDDPEGSIVGTARDSTCGPGGEVYQVCHWNAEVPSLVRFGDVWHLFSHMVPRCWFVSEVSGQVESEYVSGASFISHKISPTVVGLLSAPHRYFVGGMLTHEASPDDRYSAAIEASFASSNLDTASGTYIAGFAVTEPGAIGGPDGRLYLTLDALMPGSDSCELEKTMQVWSWDPSSSEHGISVVNDDLFSATDAQFAFTRFPSEVYDHVKQGNLVALGAGSYGLLATGGRPVEFGQTGGFNGCALFIFSDIATGTLVDVPGWNVPFVYARQFAYDGIAGSVVLENGGCTLNYLADTIVQMAVDPTGGADIYMP